MSEQDWTVLAGQAASAANLIRAFEHAEEVFKNVIKGEQTLVQLGDLVTSRKKELETLSGLLEGQRVRLKEEAERQDEKVRKELAEATSKFESLRTEKEAQIKELDNKLGSLKTAVELAEKQYSERIADLSAKADVAEKRLGKVLAEHKKLLDKLQL